MYGLTVTTTQLANMNQLGLNVNSSTFITSFVGNHPNAVQAGIFLQNIQNITQALQNGSLTLTAAQQLLTLADKLSLTVDQVSWFIGEDHDRIAETFALSNAENFNTEAETITKMMVDLSLQDVYPVSADNPTYHNIVNQYLGDLNTEGWPILDFAQIVAFYVSIEASKLKYEHPDWSTWYCYWLASKDVAHIGLDILGLVPVVGEVCDLSNGLLYATEGDWVNGSLSVTSAIPFVGWFSTGAKYAHRIVTVAGAKRRMTWMVDAAGKISFGSRNFLNTVIAAPSGTQAHHIIPWDLLEHQTIQNASKVDGLSPWHMNNPVNGIALGPVQHLGSHPQYTGAVSNKLKYINDTYGSTNSCALKTEELANEIRAIIVANPNLTVNDPAVVNLINNISL